MKIFRGWAVIGVAALSVALSGCGGGSSSSAGNASLRLANATLTHPSLDLLVNSSLAISATATDTVSAYSGPPSGAVTLQVNDAGSATALTTTVPTLTGGYHYTLLAYESGGAVQTLVIDEDYPVPPVGAVQFRIVNTAPDAGKLDVYITDPNNPSTAVLSSAISPATSFTTGVIPTFSPLLTYAAGTYRVRVTGAGNPSDLRLDIPAVTLTSQQVGIVALTPASGGILLNGSTLIQQDTYTATRNTNARVRLAAAVSGGATVTASATSGTTTTTIDGSDSVAPAFGYYTLVPAGSTLNISVNGQSVGVPPPTPTVVGSPLTAGSDSTLLVYGSPTTATPTLIPDDNRPPTDPTTVKLRLINGITGSTGAVTLTANTAPVGINIMPGAWSSYASVLGSTAPMDLSLTSSLSATPLIPNFSQTLNLGSVYTVMAAGDISAPQLLIRDSVTIR